MGVLWARSSEDVVVCRVQIKVATGSLAAGQTEALRHRREDERLGALLGRHREEVARTGV